MSHCPFTYNGIVLLPSSEGRNDIIPCCRYRGGITLKSTDLNYEYRYGEMDVLRKKLDRGEKVEACKECWINEANGIKSMRQEAIENWGIVTEPKIRYMEFELDNVCNIRCNMCSSGRSTAWIKDEIKFFGKQSFKFHYNDLYKQVDFSQLDSIKLIGGEPLLSKKINDLCERLLKSGRLDRQEIIIVTNGLITPGGIVEEVLLKCGTLNLNISCDGVGELDDFIRTGSTWNTKLKNLEYFNNLFSRRIGKETSVTIHSVITPYNLNLLHEIDNFIDQTFPNFNRTRDVCIDPDFLCIMNLPNDYKLDMINYLNNHNYTELLSFMSTNDNNLFDYFISYHKKLITRTGIDFEKINPQLSSYINSYEHKEINDDILFSRRNGQF